MGHAFACMQASTKVFSMPRPNNCRPLKSLPSPTARLRPWGRCKHSRGVGYLGRLFLHPLAAKIRADTVSPSPPTGSTKLAGSVPTLFASSYPISKSDFMNCFSWNFRTAFGQNISWTWMFKYIYFFVYLELFEVTKKLPVTERVCRRKIFNRAIPHTTVNGNCCLYKGIPRRPRKTTLERFYFQILWFSSRLLYILKSFDAK